MLVVFLEEGQTQVVNNPLTGIGSTASVSTHTPIHVQLRNDAFARPNSESGQTTTLLAGMMFPYAVECAITNHE